MESLTATCPTKMNGVALKEYFEAIIRLNNDHVLELMKQDKENVKEAFELFDKNLTIHLDRLNNSHANIRQIAESNISREKFDILHEDLIKRMEVVERALSEKKGETRVDDKVKYVIGVVLGAIITLFISYLINLITGKL